MSSLPPDELEAPAAGLRRYVTILFSDLSNSTLLGNVMEAEHYADMIGVVRTLCREIILKHGGRIARIQGDGMLAVFGYPQSRENNGRRATEAALDLHAAVTRIALSGRAAATRVLALHSGIHGGLTFVRSGGAEVGTLEVLGDVPNAAAHLAGLAGPGEIVVSEETLGPQVQHFVTDSRRTVLLKGRGHQLGVVNVIDRRPAQRRFQPGAVRGLAPLVGRVAETGELLGALSAASAGQEQFVAVVGAPGVGKTRLIEEVLHVARSSGCTVLTGYCESYLSAEPMQPFLQILRTLFGVSPGMSPGDASAAADRALAVYPQLAGVRNELLGALALASSSEARGAAPAAVGALAELLRAVSARQPLVIALDDWQWADELSQRTLDAILKLRGCVFVVLGCRGDDIDALLPPEFAIVEVGPLKLEETRETLRHLLPHADPFVADEIHGYAGGVPLFIEELCHSAQSQQLERPPAHRLAGAAWLAALVESRVGRLPPEQRSVVGAAAVMGNVFPGWLLERISGHGEASEMVRVLALRDFIFPAEQPGLLRFKHGVTRDVVYHSIGLNERMALHKRVAAAFADGDALTTKEEALEALAYHHAAGGQPEKAAEYAELAGDKALAALALDRARAQYLAALQALDAQAPLSEKLLLRWCSIAQKLGMACVWDPLALTDGVVIFEQGVAVAEQAGDPNSIARAEYWLGYIHYAKGNMREARSHCESALSSATSAGDERLAAQVRATLGQTLACSCEYEHALPLLDTALDSKRSRVRPGSSVAVGSAYALACKGSVLGDQGRFDLAEECFAEAMALVADSEHQVGSSVRNWISAVYQWQGRWEEAERIAVASSAIAERCKSRQLLAMSRALAGYAQWRTSLRGESLQAVLDATRWIEARQGALVTSLNYGWLVDGAVAEGRLDDARRHATRLFLRARQRDRLGEAMGCRALARATLRAGNPARSGVYLERAERAALARTSPHETAKNQLLAAEIALAEDRPGLAREMLDRACAGFAAMAMRWHLAEAERIRIEL